jgi:hypothetical protein
MQSELRLSQKDAARVEAALRQPKPCVVCGDPEPSYAGLFLPNKPELWGGAPGTTRLLAYALCARCTALPEITRHVEARIMAGLVGRGN